MGHAKITSDEPPSEDSILSELESIDLASVGASLGKGRSLDPVDIVEELYLVPKIPYDKLNRLEEAWKKKKKDSDAVLEELLELQNQGLVPSGWISEGVDEEEREEE